MSHLNGMKSFGKPVAFDSVVYSDASTLGCGRYILGRFSNRTGTSFRTARAAKIPRRIWVENAVVSWPRCDLARYTTPLCLFSNR